MYVSFRVFNLAEHHIARNDKLPILCYRNLHISVRMNGPVKWTFRYILWCNPRTIMQRNAWCVSGNRLFSSGVIWEDCGDRIYPLSECIIGQTEPTLAWWPYVSIRIQFGVNQVKRYTNFPFKSDSVAFCYINFRTFWNIYRNLLKSRIDRD